MREKGICEFLSKWIHNAWHIAKYKRPCLNLRQLKVKRVMCKYWSCQVTLRFCILNNAAKLSLSSFSQARHQLHFHGSQRWSQQPEQGKHPLRIFSRLFRPLGVGLVQSVLLLGVEHPPIWVLEHRQTLWKHSFSEKTLPSTVLDIWTSLPSLQTPFGPGRSMAAEIKSQGEICTFCSGKKKWKEQMLCFGWWLYCSDSFNRGS